MSIKNRFSNKKLKTIAIFIVHTLSKNKAYKLSSVHQDG